MYVARSFPHKDCDGTCDAYIPSLKVASVAYAGERGSSCNVIYWCVVTQVYCFG